MAFYPNPLVRHQSLYQFIFVRDFNNKLLDEKRKALLAQMLVENFDLAIKCILCSEVIKDDEREMAMAYITLYPNHGELNSLIK